MEEPQIRFDDGAAYEEFMGVWSRIAGETFLQWLAPEPAGRWVDVGCGNGAFTELLFERCSPHEVQGIDPSEKQIAFARGRLAEAAAYFKVGGAMALPYAPHTFDAAVMALVIFFVPDPARGVAEMARVVKPGGSVGAYAWDMHGGGFPWAAVQEEMAALGMPPLWPPSADVSRIEVMQNLWHGAGLVHIETRTIVVERSFADFDSLWKIAQTTPGTAARIATMASADTAILKRRLRARLAPHGAGPLTCRATANAVKGIRPT